MSGSSPPRPDDLAPAAGPLPDGPGPLAAPKPKRRRRRWLQFGLRGLLVLMVAVCGIFGWVSWQLRFYRERVAQIERFTEAGGILSTAPAGPAWLRELFGDERGMPFVTVNVARASRQMEDRHLEDIRDWTDLRILRLARSQVTDEGLRQLDRLTELTRLDLRDTSINGDGLICLRGMSALRFLNLNRTQVGDRALIHIAQCVNLEILDLEDTRVGDAGVSRLGGHPRLRFLSLANTPITDEAIRHISSLSALDDLSLSGTQVTNRGVLGLTTMNRLEILALRETRISDDVLEPLASMRSLKSLCIEGTQIMNRGMDCTSSFMIVN